MSDLGEKEMIVISLLNGSNSDKIIASTALSELKDIDQKLKNTERKIESDGGYAVSFYTINSFEEAVELIEYIDEKKPNAQLCVIDSVEKLETLPAHVKSMLLA